MTSRLFGHSQARMSSLIQQQVSPMNFLRQSKFSTKLLSAFIVCALITLAVGGLGMVGVTRLGNALELT